MIRLYRARWSTNVERVTLALGHKELQAESIWIDYSDRSLVEQVSGQPLVPVLEFDGEVVFDSPRIIKRLDELHPEPPLYPRDGARAAELEVFVEWFEHVWKRAPNEIERILGLPETDPHLVGELSDLMQNWLDYFESMLDVRVFLFGDDFGRRLHRLPVPEVRRRTRSDRQRVVPPHPRPAPVGRRTASLVRLDRPDQAAPTGVGASSRSESGRGAGPT